MALRTITITAGTGGQIQVFQNGTDLGYFRGTKYVAANDGDNISVWCDADTGYIFTNLCTPDGTCTTARPFNFVVNMDISMTATFTSSTGCPSTDNTLLLNGQLSPLIITPGTEVKINIRMSSGAGKQWKLIRIVDVLNPAGDTVITNGTLDSNGCSNTLVFFDKAGVYILEGIWCDVWVGDYGAHCFTSDSITNKVYVTVKSTPPPGGTTCDPATCPSNANFCIAGNCVPKPVVLVGAIALLLMMTMRN